MFLVKKVEKDEINIIFGDLLNLNDKA